MFVIGQRPGILVLIQNVTRRPIWFKVISDPKDPQGCSVGQGAGDCRLNVMLAFLGHQHEQSLHLAPGIVTFSLVLGNSYHARTQDELTAPAQTLLLPDCQGLCSSCPPVPLLFMFSHLASCFPSPKLSKEGHHPAPGSWHPTFSFLPASLLLSVA